MKALGRGSIASILKTVLDILWIILWLGAAVLGVGTVLYLLAVVGVSNGWLSASTLEGDHLSFHMPGLETHVISSRMVWTVVVAGLLGAGLFIATALIIVSRLKRLFANFASEQPFLLENASHLRVIWIAMIVQELGRYAVAGLAVLLSKLFAFSDGRMEVKFELQLENWFAIFTLMVLEEVFRVGARLREEQDLTI